MKELSDLEFHLHWVVREDLSKVTIRLRPKLMKNRSCKDMTKRVSGKGNGPGKAQPWIL